MPAATRRRRLRPAARSFLASLRAFLTPAVWKAAHHARPRRQRSPRWDSQPLLVVLLTMTWCCGDSLAERFETARAFAGVCLSKRRRPGKTLSGFHKALARLPVAVLRAVAAALRRRLAARFDLSTDGFHVFGCDGSRLECPRVEALERRLGRIGKKAVAPVAPMVWVTALVHLRTGLLWAWRLGKGTAAERRHLVTLLPTLPAFSLVVADAGFNGYALAQALVQAQASFLIRMSGKLSLYVEQPVAVKDFREGPVCCWPQEARRAKQPPLRLRLLRLRGPKRRDVWLLTNVLDGQRLSAEQAGRYYRWRWESEGLFRTYKRTLNKVKLLSRTVRLVHREAEGSLLATQLLLALGVQGISRASGAAAAASKEGTAVGEPQRCSPRQVLRLIRRAINGSGGPGGSFAEQVRAARRERRRRKSKKVKRRWPRRKASQRLKPPKFLVLSERLKALRAKLESSAA
jgi:hypothetical protein